MPTIEIEKQYNELKKKLKLPEFKELDFEFEISDLEETNFLLKATIRRMAEKLDFYSTMLEEVLQPDTSNLYAMHETKFFDEDEKIDGVALETTGFPDPVAIADDEPRISMARRIISRYPVKAAWRRS